jgi:hypothetical protein
MWDNQPVMRTIQVALLGAIFAALVVIGFQLQAISRDLAPYGAAARGAARLLSADPETREQRNSRLQREQQERILDARAILATPSPPKRVSTPK